MRFDVIRFFVIIIMLLVEEVVLPSHGLDETIDVEDFQRVVSGETGETSTGSHIRVIVFEFIFFEYFFIYQKVTHGSVFDLLTDEILDVESTDTSFDFVISGSSSSEHDPLVRMEALSKHRFV